MTTAATTNTTTTTTTTTATTTTTTTSMIMAMTMTMMMVTMMLFKERHSICHVKCKLVICVLRCIIIYRGIMVRFAQRDWSAFMEQ